VTLDDNAVSIFVSGQNRPDQRLVVISHARIRSDEAFAVRKFLSGCSIISLRSFFAGKTRAKGIA
jgi:hypothetical protein